jgi:hypothetical protein
MAKGKHRHEIHTPKNPLDAFLAGYVTAPLSRRDLFNGSRYVPRQQPSVSYKTLLWDHFMTRKQDIRIISHTQVHTSSLNFSSACVGEFSGSADST